MARRKNPRNRVNFRRSKFNWRDAMSTGAKVAQTASKALGVARMVAGVVNAEKNFYTTNASANITYNGTVYGLSQIAAGDDVAQRTGNSILAKYVSVNLSLGINASATQSQVRIILFIDLLNQGTDPTPTDILTATYLGNGYAPLAPVNVDATSRFWVIYNKTFGLSNAGVKLKPVKIFKRLNKHIKFTGTAGGNIYKNQVYMLLISDEATNTPLVNWVSRLAYYDN